MSCVLRVQDAQGRSLLLTGDIEAPQEQALVQRHGAALASTVMLVPHHAAAPRPPRPGWRPCRPNWAVVQAGYRSRYGHPAPDIMDRYARQASPWCALTVVVHGCGTMVQPGAPAMCDAATGMRHRPWLVRKLLTFPCQDLWSQEPLLDETDL